MRGSACQSPRNCSRGMSRSSRQGAGPVESLAASEVVIDVPDIPAKCICCPLQRPGEQGQLAPEAAFLEAQAGRHPGRGGPRVSGASRAQQPHVVQQGAQRVVSAAQEDVAERRVGRRHVLGQKVELHLRKEGDQVGVMALPGSEGLNRSSYPRGNLVRV